MEGWYSIIFHRTLLDSLLTAMLIAVQNLEWIFASLDVYPLHLSCVHTENVAESCNLEKVMKWLAFLFLFFSIEIHVSSGEKDILESHYLPLLEARGHSKESWLFTTYRDVNSTPGP